MKNKILFNIYLLRIGELNFVGINFIMICKALGFIHKYIITKDQDSITPDYSLDLTKLKNILDKIIK